MTEAAAHIRAWQTYRNKRGEVRTIVEIATNGHLKRAGQVTRKRVIYRDAAGVEMSCRLDKFLNWKKRGEAVLVESEGA